jgi:site-specific DNA recombinase
VAVAVETPVRCAIYTRKSTDEGLDREFNTLQAQRAAAEAYIDSQRGEGWTCLSDAYDDGGFSGATMSRPAMQRLMADVEAGRIDCIVVYKLDRLSRNVRDYLNFLAFLDDRDVAFVSVTQQFNTSTPLGRMTLKQLLLFAEFERDMTAERTRDKMRAARRRGRWTGGMPPLGYDVIPEGGRIVANRDESDTVKTIFELYLEKRSLLAVVWELRCMGVRRKSWTTRDGKVRIGREFNNVDLHRLLTDPLYAGMQKLGDETFKGEQPAIISKAVFDRVQRILVENRRNAGASHRNRHGALLRGILRCSACDSAMTHAFTERRGKAFRYYRCVNSVKRGAAACPTGSVPAQKIEASVVEQIQRIGADSVLCDETFRQVQAQVATERRGLKAEAKRIDRDLVVGRSEVDRLTSAVGRATGAAADAVMVKLAATQERLATLERRQHEVTDRLVALDGQDVDPEALRSALAQFTELWEVLLTPERERIVRLLVDRVDYHRADGELRITFSSTGAKLLAGEFAS